MTWVGWLFLVIMAAAPIGWLAAELSAGRKARITLGILALLVVGAGVAVVSQVVLRFNYNAWYGGATGGLLRASIQQVEEGQLERVLTVWRGLEQQYKPTYENRAHYDELVEQATQRICGETEIEPESPWNGREYKRETWDGHWENDTGYWIVIGWAGVMRSGDPPTKMHSMSVSPDNKTLTVFEGDTWRHRLTLVDTREATHEWFDLKQQRVWKTDSLYKLVRAPLVASDGGGEAEGK